MTNFDIERITGQSASEIKATELKKISETNPELAEKLARILPRTADAGTPRVQEPKSSGFSQPTLRGAKAHDFEMRKQLGEDF